MAERLLIPVLCRGILDSIPGRWNLQIKIILKSWSIGLWLPVSLKHYMQHFTLSPTVGPRCWPFIILSACPFLEGCLIRYDTPRTLRTSWGTQAIDYSWANLDTFHAAQTSKLQISSHIATHCNVCHESLTCDCCYHNSLIHHRAFLALSLLGSFFLFSIETPIVVTQNSRDCFDLLHIRVFGTWILDSRPCILQSVARKKLMYVTVLLLRMSTLVNCFYPPMGRPL